jgi:predicted nucleic acid-binding protein
VDLEEALRLADELGIYAYDAYPIACARQRRCGLITLDRRLGRAAKTTGVAVVEVEG